MTRSQILRLAPALLLAVAGFAASGGAAHASTYEPWAYDFSGYQVGSVHFTGSFYYDGSTVTNPLWGECKPNWYEQQWGNAHVAGAGSFWDNSQHSEVTFYCNIQFQNLYTGQWVTCYPRVDGWYNGTTYPYDGNNNTCS